MASIYETQRQEEIAAAAAKSFGVKPSDITAIATEFDLPTAITYTNESGTNITRDIRASYGELLTDSEYRELIAQRTSAASSRLESLNGYDSLLGQSKKPVSIEDSNLVKQDTSNANTFNSSRNRLASAGLPNGAQNVVGGTDPIIKFKNSNGADHRVRILVPSGALTGILLQSPITNPLIETNGVLFPYTPQIVVNHTASYDAQNLTHSNYAYQFYQSSTVEEISITGTFSAKNSTDALYVLAAQHFFRTVTKMFYGQDPLAGTPPPVLRLDGHGDLQFSSVPIVITGFTSSYPDDVDYITAGTSASSFRAAESSPFTAGQLDSATRDLGRVPVIQQFTINCRPVYSRKSISGEFGVTRFVAGQLLGSAKRGGYL